MQGTTMTRVRLLVAASALGALSLSLSAQSASTTITRSPGNLARDTTVTGPNGKTATYQNTASWANGTYNDSRSVVGFNGKTANYQNYATWGNGAFNSNKSWTGTNGGTVSKATARSGGIVTNTYTGRNGNSRTINRFAGYRRRR